MVGTAFTKARSRIFSEKVSYQITVFIREQVRHGWQPQQRSNKPMIPKILTGYNVPWLAGNTNRSASPGCLEFDFID